MNLTIYYIDSIHAVDDSCIARVHTKSLETIIPSLLNSFDLNYYTIDYDKKAFTRTGFMKELYIFPDSDLLDRSYDIIPYIDCIFAEPVVDLSTIIRYINRRIEQHELKNSLGVEGLCLFDGIIDNL